MLTLNIVFLSRLVLLLLVYRHVSSILAVDTSHIAEYVVYIFTVSLFFAYEYFHLKELCVFFCKHLKFVLLLAFSMIYEVWTSMDLVYTTLQCSLNAALSIPLLCKTAFLCGCVCRALCRTENERRVKY